MTSIPEIDYSRVVTDLIARSAQGLASALCGTAKEKVDHARVKLGTVFTRYLDDQFVKRSRVKTLLYRRDPRFLYDFYIPHDLEHDGETIDDVDAVVLYNTFRHCVITGTGGSGKSILLRHIFIDTIVNTDYVPIFIDLRDTNSNGTTLNDVLYRSIDLSPIDLKQSALEYAFEQGSFALMLDGLDEVVSEKRSSIAKEIQALRDSFSRMPIVVTSRPDDRFVGWDGFTTLDVKPFELDKIKALLTRLDYNDGDKLRFMTDVESSLYLTHQSFLSNPLLLTIMLITYSHNASVPNKNHLFYSQVFDALWNQHDATKDGYTRRLAAELQRDKFEQVLESFSFQTWWDSLVSFSHTDSEMYLSRSRNIASVEFDSSDYLEDLTRSVCVLVKDGLLYTYTHRSFQEYYAARFLLNSEESFRKRAYPSLLERSKSDAVLRLLWEMRPSIVEREVLIPILEELESAIKPLSNDDEKLFAYFNFWCEKLIVDAHSKYFPIGHTSRSPNAAALDFIKREYSEAFESQHEDEGLTAAEVEQFKLEFATLCNGKSHLPIEECAPALEMIKKLGKYRKIYQLGSASILLSLLDDMRQRANSASQTLEELFEGG